jgi:hypothetical protein
MIRKQLYITDVHERALKMKAREMGVSEAELVRRLLDRLRLEAGEGVLAFGRVEAALGFLEAADRNRGVRFLEPFDPAIDLAALG